MESPKKKLEEAIERYRRIIEASKKAGESIREGKISS